MRNVDWSLLGVKLPYCLAPWMVAYIQSDGLVRPCCIHPPTLGNTNVNTMEEIWNAPSFAGLRQSMLGRAPLPEICTTCNDGLRYVNVDEYVLFQMEEMCARNESDKVLRLFETLAQQNVLIEGAIPIIALLLEDMRSNGELLEALRFFESLVKHKVLLIEAMPIIALLLEDLSATGEIHKVLRLFESLVQHNVVIVEAFPLISKLLEQMYAQGEAEEARRLFTNLVQHNVVIVEAFPLISRLLKKMCAEGEIEEAKRLFTDLVLNKVIIFKAVRFMAPLFGTHYFYWCSFIPPQRALLWKVWYVGYLVQLFFAGERLQGAPFSFDPMFWWHVSGKFPEVADRLKKLVGICYSSEEELFQAVGHCIGAELTEECRPLLEAELVMIRDPRRLGRELLRRLVTRQ